MTNSEFGEFGEALEKFLRIETINDGARLLSESVNRRFQKLLTVEPGQRIFRCRIIETLDQIKTIDDLSYPTPEKVEIASGRLNDKGEAVFYGASHRITAFMETVSEDFFVDHFPVMACISEWTNKTVIPHLQLGVVGLDRLRISKDTQTLPADHEQLIFEELVHQLFKFPGPDHYVRTTAIRRYLQDEVGRLNNPWSNHDLGILYPTVKMQELYNAPYNIALSPQTADNKIKLQDVKIWTVERALAGDPNAVVMKPEREFEGVDQGIIIWRKKENS